MPNNGQHYYNMIWFESDTNLSIVSTVASLDIFVASFLATAHCDGLSYTTEVPQ